LTATELSVAIEELQINPEARKVPKPVLAEALLHGAALESRRIERELRALFDRECPAIAKLAAAPWIAKAERIIRAQGVK